MVNAIRAKFKRLSYRQKMNRLEKLLKDPILAPYLNSFISSLIRNGALDTQVSERMRVIARERRKANRSKGKIRRL